MFTVSAGCQPSSPSSFSTPRHSWSGTNYFSFIALLYNNPNSSFSFFFPFFLLEWMNEWIYSLDRITVSQAGTPRHDNCVRLPVSWKPINNWLHTIVKTSIMNKSYLVIKTYKNTYTKHNTHEWMNNFFFYYSMLLLLLLLLNILQY